MGRAEEICSKVEETKGESGKEKRVLSNGEKVGSMETTQRRRKEHLDPKKKKFSPSADDHYRKVERRREGKKDKASSTRHLLRRRKEKGIWTETRTVKGKEKKERGVKTLHSWEKGSMTRV